MPCDSEYLEPTWNEKEASRLLAVAQEVVAGFRVKPKTFGNGTWKGEYASLSKQERDNIVKNLCVILTGTDTSKYSLEVQMWWRDHQEADKKRGR